MFIVSFDKISKPPPPPPTEGIFLFDPHTAHNIQHIAGITYETKNKLAKIGEIRTDVNLACTSLLLATVINTFHDTRSAVVWLSKSILIFA